MVVDTFSGNPLSKDALDRNFFLKTPDGTLWKRHSGCFPIVPCYLIDGNNAKAADWFAELYKQWQVDGIKEDTMMYLGQGHLDVFNQPIARIADDGGLVMARCGSFTSPGTLTRINDTHVNQLTQRIPINYLQNAACGAPNAYSDTVGFKKMKSYSELVGSPTPGCSHSPPGSRLASPRPTGRRSNKPSSKSPSTSTTTSSPPFTMPP